MSSDSSVFEGTTIAGTRGAVRDRHSARDEVKMLDLSEPIRAGGGVGPGGRKIRNSRFFKREVLAAPVELSDRIYVGIASDSRVSRGIHGGFTILSSSRLSPAQVEAPAGSRARAWVWGQPCIGSDEARRSYSTYYSR